MAVYKRNPRHEFAVVMDRIPAADKDMIWALWTMEGRFDPEIKLVSPEEMTEAGGSSIAAVRGGTYYFLKEVFDTAPSKILHALIAHELSHTVASSEGSSKDEETIRRRANSWGFEQTPAIEWAREKFGNG